MGRKHILLVKFGQFMSCYTRRKFYQKILQKMRHESKVLCLQRIEHNLYWKMKFLKQATQICFRKICPNQHNDPLRFRSADDSFKIKKGLELVPRPHFSYNFSINLPSFITRLYFLTKLFSKMCFLFHV